MNIVGCRAVTRSGWTSHYVLMKFSKSHRIHENEHRDPMINRVHDPTMVNGCTKYEHDPLDIVGCRAVTRAGWTSHHVFIKFSKSHRIQENQHRDPQINRVHPPTKVNGCTKYQQDPFNIVGCRAVTRSGKILKVPQNPGKST